MPAFFDEADATAGALLYFVPEERLILPKRLSILMFLRHLSNLL